MGLTKERLDGVALAAIMTVIFPVLVLLLASGLRRSFAPDDPAVLMWWADTLNDVTLRALAIAVVAALGVSIAVLARPQIAWWKIARWVWGGSALLAVGAVALAARADVRVYADRIVVTAIDGSQSAVPLTNAREVEVWCDVINRRRDADIATIGYVIHFQDGSVALRSAMHDKSPDAARAWFRTVEALDREVLAAVPHTRYGEGHDMICIRALRAELGETDFAAARRMLGINDTDFARYYAEPHEAWKRGAEDAR